MRRVIVIGALAVTGAAFTIFELPTDKEMDYNYEYSQPAELSSSIEDNIEKEYNTQGWIPPVENSDYQVENSDK